MCQDADIGEAGFHEKLPWAAVCVLFRHYPNSLVYMRLLELLARAPSCYGVALESVFPINSVLL